MNRRHPAARPPFTLLGRGERRAVAAAGLAAGLAVAAAALLPFLEAGATPWLAAEGRYAQQAARCAASAGAGSRHRCLRAVAAAAASAPRQVLAAVQ